MSKNKRHQKHHVFIDINVTFGTEVIKADVRGIHQLREARLIKAIALQKRVEKPDPDLINLSQSVINIRVRQGPGAFYPVELPQTYENYLSAFGIAGLQEKVRLSLSSQRQYRIPELSINLDFTTVNTP